MKYGLFVHQLIDDPSKGDASFGRIRPGGPIECSESGSKLKTYFQNQKIVEELRKTYNVVTLNSLDTAVTRLSGCDPLNDFSFMITNCPPNDYSRRLFRDERLNYFESIDALLEIRKNRPEMVLIAYTGAPLEIRKVCHELGAVVLSRARFGLDVEIEELKRMIEGKPTVDRFGD